MPNNLLRLEFLLFCREAKKIEKNKTFGSTVKEFPGGVFSGLASGTAFLCRI
jgi:hypothetical protein